MGFLTKKLVFDLCEKPFEKRKECNTGTPPKKGSIIPK